MSRSTLAFLLGLSLLFNIVFIIGTIRQSSATGIDPTSPEAVAQFVAHEMGLDTEQHRVFQWLRSSFRDETAGLRSQQRDLDLQIAQELDAPDGDMEAIRQLMTEREEIAHAMHDVSMRYFNEFLVVLSSEQRQQLTGRMLHDRGRRGGNHLEQWDTDGDGQLNETERAAAHEGAQQRHADWERLRQEAMTRFDVDGDGRLSPEERQNLRAWMIEQAKEAGRPVRGGPPGEGRPGSGERRGPRGDGPRRGQGPGHGDGPPPGAPVPPAPGDPGSHSPNDS